MYVRRVTSRGTGPYFQLVETYRIQGLRTPRTRVLVHLGKHETAAKALGAWPQEAQHLRAIGRVAQAEKLEAKLERLRSLVERGEKDAR